jgi:hypothetical protein
MPGNEMHRERQRRYRRRLCVERIPEASAVDIAVSAAVARFAEDAAKGSPSDAETVRRILVPSVEILEDRGYSRPAARRKVIQRLARRDAVSADAISGGQKL